jgi:hypothetical protein
MSDDYAARVEELLDEACALDDGPAKVMLLEEAVRLADSSGDADLAFDVRQDLIHAATFGGYPERALVAFTWSLAHCDRARGGALDHGTLWKYKWIGNALPEFPQIPLGQIHAVLDDMSRRYERAGMSLRAVHKLRCGLAMGMGDREAARAHHAAWQQAPVDSVSDCPACERNHRVKYLFFMDREAEGVTHAAPILTGRLRCAEIPHATLAHVLLPLVRLGRLEEAVAHHRQGLRLVARNRTFVREVAMHMTFLALTDNLAQAVRLLEKHLAWALEKEGHARRFDFFLAARFLLERLEAGGKSVMRLRLPANFPLRSESGKYELTELAAWFDADLRALGERFDARNGTDRFARRLAENRELKELVAPFPLRRQRDGERGPV